MEDKLTTYNESDYLEYSKRGDINYFEEVIDKMIMEGLAGMNDKFRDIISNLPIDRKRMTILSLLDKDLNLFKRIKALTDKNINKMEHVKDIILMLREYVKVGEVEKKKFGEVMTPLELVKEMLATLPEDVWSNPDLKWLDPANGTGPYPVMVIYKLMNGLKGWEPDDEKRYKHIVENMIYVCELQPKNMFLYMCAVDPFDKYKLNIYTGSFLEEGFDKHMKEVWDLEKFDIVVGNPPYQNSTGKLGKTASTLWPRFLQKTIETMLTYDGFLLFITPISWMSPGKQLIRNRIIPIYFKCNEFLYLNMDCGEYFGGVGSYFSYYLLKIKSRYNEKKIVKSNTNIKSNKENITFDFTDFDFIPKPNDIETLNIVSKVFDKKHKKLNLLSSSLTRSDKNWVQKNKSEKNIYHIKHTNSEILWSSIKPDSYGIKKVIFNSTGNFNPTYDNGCLGTSQITRWVEVGSKEEGEKLISFLNSKLIKHILSSCRWSGAASKIVFENIPSIDFSNYLSDLDLYQYFELSEDEIKIIEEKIK